ncbi:MAG: DUF2911 domain-containing protein [Bacteroidetes bacterium]|nr:DUF2911 domain-containing protein [Bacteroidota bacterium]
MKKFFLLLIFFQTAFSCLLAQNNSIPPVDKSPMDMSYYPVNYPILKIQDKITEPLVTRVIYSRPQRNGRTIFGGLVKNGEVWRLGANEATEIEFFRAVKIGGKKLKAGRYTLYAIVNDNSWTIIVNRETDTWGSFKYDIKKDVVRTDVTLQKTDGLVENMSMAFEKTAVGCNLSISWENTKVAVPIIF